MLIDAPMDQAVRDVAIRRIEFTRERGESLEVAVKEAKEFIRSEGLINALFDEVAETWLRLMWRERVKDDRTTALIGSRRHDSAPLQGSGSLFESLYPVRGEWKRLGDLDQSEVVELETAYRQRVAENAKYASFFGCVAERMGEGKTVRESFSEAGLRALYEQA